MRSCFCPTLQHYRQAEQCSGVGQWTTKLSSSQQWRWFTSTHSHQFYWCWEPFLQYCSPQFHLQITGINRICRAAPTGVQAVCQQKVSSQVGDLGLHTQDSHDFQSINTICSGTAQDHPAHLAHVPALPQSSGRKFRWLQVQQDRWEHLLHLNFSLSLHRATGSAPTGHTWSSFHSTGTGSPRCQMCFALLCCPTLLWSRVLQP